MPADDWSVPSEWDNAETDMFAALLGDEPEIINDTQLQMLYHGGYFDSELDLATRETFQVELDQYLWNEYHIDFDEMFDWDAYREWYESG